MRRLSTAVHRGKETGMELKTKADMNAFLGKRILEEYPELYPVMSYALMRLAALLNTDNVINQVPLIRSYDYYQPYAGVSAAKRFVFRMYKLAFRAINTFSPRCKGEQVLLSQTFTLNQRYCNTLKAFKRQNDCATFLCGSFEMTLFNKHDLKATFSRLFLKRKTGIYPIIWDQTLLPQSFLVACQRWFDAVTVATRNYKCLSDSYEEMKPFFDDLREEYRSALLRVAQMLTENRIRLYITINPFYLSEIMTIIACNQLHIPCRNVEHHVSQFGFFAQTEPFYINHIYVWNVAEALYRKNNFTYEYMLTVEDRQPNTDICGMLELTVEQMEYYRNKYQQKHLLLFAVPPNYIYTYEGKLQYQKWCHTVYEQLHQLHCSTGVAVRIRFYPMSLNEKDSGTDLDKEYHINDDLIRSYGFEISKSTTTNLMQDLFECMALFTAGSTIAAVASAIGKQVYQVYCEQFPSQIYDKGIMGVEADKISALPVEDSKQVHKKVLESNRFFRVDELLKADCNEDW